MQKPPHIKLLELMANAGIGRSINVDSFISENFRIKVNDNHRDKPITPSQPILFLEDLINRGMISSENENTGAWLFSSDGDFFTPRWISDDNSNAAYYYLTSIGLDYLENYNNSRINAELNKSYKNVNEASLRSYSAQFRLSILTLALAFVSALMSLVTYFKSDETATSVDKLRKELQQWRILQESRQNQTAYPKAYPHK